jgi:amino-acid N-acetyltransferase
MKRIEARAREAGVKTLFVLTTVTSHWFIERGFSERSVDELPDEKRLVYNLQRRSKVLMKPL